MDRYGSFNQDQAWQAEDAAVEAPPAIGTDERRMHVRAYNYWVSLLDGRAYPSVEDLDPESLPDFGPHSVLLDFTSGVETPSITYLGDKLRLECDLDEGIGSVAEVPARSLLSRLTDHYLQIIANRAPIGFEAEFVNHRGNNTFYRGILMPYSSDDDTIDFIYGVINWKEVADQTLTDTLVDELQRVAASDVLVTEGPVSAWADGPGNAPVKAAVSASPHLAAPELDLGLDMEMDAAPDYYEPDGSEGLGDWLAIARECADVARSADIRSRGALYRALSHAYDFALSAAANKADYEEMLQDCGITAQARAPMTPVVKLVFGADYDKTRLAEFAAVLTYAKEAAVGRGGLEARLENFKGGIKGMIKEGRALRRPVRAVVTTAKDYARVRGLPSVGVVDLAGESEFVLLIARRVDGERVAVIGTPCDDDALLDKALTLLNK